MKRGLLVGIDEYTQFASLGGCANDVQALLPLLSRHQDDSPNFDCQAITESETLTRGRLLDAIGGLLSPGADEAVLFFAGHGQAASNDVSLVCYDGTSTTPGVALSEIMGLVAASDVDRITIILDCCFSGGAGGMPALATDAVVLRPGIAILTASRPDEAAAELPIGRGAFSAYLEGALEGGAADVLGNVTVGGLYAYLSESFGAWEQKPLLKAHMLRPQQLRRCDPWVPLEVLRDLPNVFGTPESEIELDPSFEPTEEPRDADNEALFGRLQRLRSAKLVEPIGEEHMYFAAMAGKSCGLTPLGRHYWRMARDGRL
jgi:hypothetical protein